MSDLEKAIKTWLDYEDSDRFDEDKARELTKARIEVREALRAGYKLVDLEKLVEKIEQYEAECLECNRVCFESIKKIIREMCE